MSEPLILAIPSKGRLMDQALEFLSRSGLKVQRAGGGRDYRGAIRGLDGVEVAFLSASEIAAELSRGGVHLGLTGLDLIFETVADETEREARIFAVTALGFGHADVVVAVPNHWVDVDSLSDLADVAERHRARHGQTMRVATKFVNLTRGHFARHGVFDYHIVESAGATEGAPVAGAADFIVDITTTGATLSANRLKVLPRDGTMLKSQAHLFAALGASWTDDTRALAATVVERVAAEIRAADILELRAVVPDPVTTAKFATDRFDAALPFGLDVTPLTLHVRRAQASECASWLRTHYAAAVTIAHVTDVYDEHPMTRELAEALGPRPG